MHRLNELVTRLTPAEIQEVEDFAEFLSSRKENVLFRSSKSGDERHIDVDALVGLCQGMGGDRTDKELIRESWDAVVDEAMK